MSKIDADDALHARFADKISTPVQISEEQ